jgi:hypothetical protein
MIPTRVKVQDIAQLIWAVHTNYHSERPNPTALQQSNYNNFICVKNIQRSFTQ